MLETVRSTIESLPDITFEQYFMQYIMSVQDENIKLETASVFRNVSPDVRNVSKAEHLIYKTIEGLVKL